MYESRINWDRTGLNQYTTAKPHKAGGYTAVINISGGVHTLTITGSGAPAAAPYTTLRAAKNAFRKFLRTK